MTRASISNGLPARGAGRGPRPPLLALGLMLSSLLAGACGSALVGGECRKGALECDGRCIDPRTDPDHCGGCDVSCGAFTCANGTCTTELRPDAPDAAITGMDAATGLDAGRPDAGPRRRDSGTGFGGTGFPLSPDGGFFGFDRDAATGGGTLGCPLGESNCADRCVDLTADVEHCGRCDNVCQADWVCSGGTCVPECDPPLNRCRLGCYDFTKDPRHCGACRKSCASGVCEDGVCADAVPGHVAVIGHDFQSGNGAMRRVAGNALFLARGAPVRALFYRGSAIDASVTGVEGAFALVERQDGRTYTQIDADPDRVPEQLGDADAFVILPQSGSSDAELEMLGQQWGLAMAQFVVTGGVIIVFETPTSDNSGTFRVLEPAALFDAAGRERVASQRLEVPEAGVGLAVLVPSAGYQTANATVRFLDPDPAARVVVEDRDGEAVVLHRVLSP